MHAPLRDRCENGQMNGRETVAEYIAKRRKALGMSQDKLAEALRVTRTVVSRWETGALRPGPHQLDDLTRVLDDGGQLAVLAQHDDGDRRPLFDPPIRVDDLLRSIGDALIGFLSEEVTPAGDAPGYGWRHEMDNPSAAPSAWATACVFRAVALAGSLDRRVSLPQVRETIRRLELRSGGWTARTHGYTARPEITAAAAGALHEAGEDREYVAARVETIVGLLDHRAPGAELARTYVLASSLIELSRLDVDDPVGRRLVDDLVDLSQVVDGARGWPAFVRESPLGMRSSSTVHTAMSVCAIASWARRLEDARLLDLARAGATWLERHADLDLDDEVLSTQRDDGLVDRLPIRHFTSAWVVQAALAAGAHPSSALVDRAMRDVMRFFVPGARIWRWPRSDSEYPAWMTYHGVAAITTWAMAHQLA